MINIHASVEFPSKSWGLADFYPPSDSVGSMAWLAAWLPSSDFSVVPSVSLSSGWDSIVLLYKIMYVFMLSCRAFASYGADPSSVVALPSDLMVAHDPGDSSWGSVSSSVLSAAVGAFFGLVLCVPTFQFLFRSVSWLRLRSGPTTPSLIPYRTTFCTAFKYAPYDVLLLHTKRWVLSIRTLISIYRRLLCVPRIPSLRWDPRHII